MLNDDAIKTLLNSSGTATADVPELFDRTRDDLRLAAVMILLMRQADQDHILLTKRRSHMRMHAGQIAFPGGRMDAADGSVIDAALRETQEEVGIAPSDISILGTMAPHYTITNFHVTPVIGRLTGAFAPTRQEAEVDVIFSAPAAHLLDLSRFIEHDRVFKGRRRSYLAVPYGPFYVWGATARMLHSFATVVARG